MHAIPSPSPITSLSSSHPTTTMLSLFRHYYCCCYYYVMSTTILLLCALVILNHSVTAFHITNQAPIVLFPSITSSSASTTRTFFSSSRVVSTTSHHSSSSALNMVRNRGLERRVEGATPLPGGMTLYIKPGPDGKSIGDCPFAHFVRIVLAEKNLDYDIVPCTPDTKPNWLVEEYGGKMPALRHRKECYVDSEVIVQYLDFFFVEPELSPRRSSGKGKGGVDAMTVATKAVEGFFPAMAKYIKYRGGTNGDEEDMTRRSVLEERLRALEDHLSDETRMSSSTSTEGGGEEGSGGDCGPYIVGNGKQFTLLDCSLAPKLYALDVCLTEVKGWTADELQSKFPHVRKYMDALFDRPSFQKTVEYGKETVVWGWTSDH